MLFSLKANFLFESVWYNTANIKSHSRAPVNWKSSSVFFFCLLSPIQATIELGKDWTRHSNGLFTLLSVGQWKRTESVEFTQQNILLIQSWWWHASYFRWGNAFVHFGGFGDCFNACNVMSTYCQVLSVHPSILLIRDDK